MAYEVAGLCHPKNTIEHVRVDDIVKCLCTCTCRQNITLAFYHIHVQYSYILVCAEGSCIGKYKIWAWKLIGPALHIATYRYVVHGPVAVSSKLGSADFSGRHVGRFAWAPAFEDHGCVIGSVGISRTAMQATVI